MASFMLLAPVMVTSCAGGTAPEEVVLNVSELDNYYLLSVPVSRLVMKIPKGQLVQTRIGSGGATDSPRYFSFQDQGQALIVSGWFESSMRYSNFNRYWLEVKDSWRSRDIPPPVNEKFFRLGGWEAVAYDMPLSGVKNSHIKACWVQAGTWIDLHLSLTSAPASHGSQEKLRNFLSSIQVTRRP